MTRKNEMALSELTENIFDVIAHTMFSRQAQSDLTEYLEDKNLKLNRDAGLIRILDEGTGQELYKITVTKL